jgi:hypothetical protein
MSEEIFTILQKRAAEENVEIVIRCAAMISITAK